ncbi:MAG: hypothetical protein KC535_04120 [Nanoarchaeota archaeon]|nr:hypothetical protein [Nanoarchaeota archaeon]
MSTKGFEPILHGYLITAIAMAGIFAYVAADNRKEAKDWKVKYERTFEEKDSLDALLEFTQENRVEDSTALVALQQSYDSLLRIQDYQQAFSAIENPSEEQF